MGDYYRKTWYKLVTWFESEKNQEIAKELWSKAIKGELKMDDLFRNTVNDEEEGKEKQGYSHYLFLLILAIVLLQHVQILSLIRIILIIMVIFVVILNIAVLAIVITHHIQLLF